LKSSIKNIFSSTLILLMGVFLSLNCNIKREIKEAIDINVSHAPHPEKVNTANTCPSFAKAENKVNLASKTQKNLSRHTYKIEFDFQQTENFTHHIYSFAGKSIPASLPIYILHGQFLI